MVLVPARLVPAFLRLAGPPSFMETIDANSRKNKYFRKSLRSKAVLVLVSWVQTV